MSQVIDEIRILSFQVKYLLSSKGSEGKKPILLDRPQTAFEKLLEDMEYSQSKEEADELLKMTGFESW